MDIEPPLPTFKKWLTNISLIVDNEKFGYKYYYDKEKDRTTFECWCKDKNNESHLKEMKHIWGLNGY